MSEIQCKWKVIRRWLAVELRGSTMILHHIINFFSREAIDRFECCRAAKCFINNRKIMLRPQLLIAIIKLSLKCKAMWHWGDVRIPIAQNLQSHWVLFNPPPTHFLSLILAPDPARNHELIHKTHKTKQDLIIYKLHQHTRINKMRKRKFFFSQNTFFLLFW